MNTVCTSLILAATLGCAPLAAIAQGTWIEVDRLNTNTPPPKSGVTEGVTGMACWADMKSLVRTGAFAYINVTCGLVKGNVPWMNPDQLSKRVLGAWEIDCAKKQYRSGTTKPWQTFPDPKHAMAARVGTIACR